MQCEPDTVRILKNKQIHKIHTYKHKPDAEASYR